jgi:uncharacterized membrane protein YfcA
MPGVLLDPILGFVIGLSLGLLGGGGSILTVPMLVYIVGQTPQAAVTASLAIVGANSALGALFHRTQGTLNWKVAILFGGAGMVAAYLSAGLSKLLPAVWLLILFAVLMILVGWLMLVRRTSSAEERSAAAWPTVLLVGAGVGVLTGFLGVGGGFLIVPALVMLVGLPMRMAVGTSLVVIAMNSLAGLMGHLAGAALDWGLIIIFVSSGLAGTFAGARLAHRLPADRLRMAFAIFVMLLALFLLWDNVPKLTH